MNLKTTNKLTQSLLIVCLVSLSSCDFINNRKKSPALDSLIPLDVVTNLLAPYSEKEMHLIHCDLKNIKELCFRDTTPSKEPMYIATAGGPGACKSTILEIFLHNRPNCVYADPDQRALKYMINTYHQSLSNYEGITYPNHQELCKNAYNKWRNASNYIANTIINEAFANGYNIAHGTTSTAKTIESLYQRLKQKKYKIILLLCYAPDETRLKANEHRTNVQGFVQVTPEDAINKGKMFHQRFPIYFNYADKIYFYWTEDFLKGSVHAATYEKGKGLIVTNNEALRNFTQKYDDDRKGSNLPSFDELIKNK